MRCRPPVGEPLKSVPDASEVGIETEGEKQAKDDEPERVKLEAVVRVVDR
jgi:hypothetical protein